MLLGDYWKCKEIKEKVRETLKLVGLSGIEEKKPAELSGGMKKRVGLARAIAMDPEYVLYDEPTTGIDPIMADVINDLIINLRNTLSITSIAVTHDIVSAYKIADRIIDEVNGVDETYVWLLSRIGRPINEPSVISAQVIPKKGVSMKSLVPSIEEIIDDEFDHLDDFCNALADGHVGLR
jgi:energy-coupling factor transporter ATP-binding protein EcfA2